MYLTLKELLERRKGQTYKWSQRNQHLNLANKPLISHQSNIFTIGSCFASNLVAYMPSMGLRGSTHPARPFYHTRSILQEFKRLLLADDEQDRHPLWLTKAGFVHPFKNHLETATFQTESECLEWARKIDEEATSRLQQADIIVITLGLIEAWFDEVGGISYKAMPPGEVFNDLKPQFRRLTVTEMITDLQEIYSLIKAHLKAELIITVSPIPLNQTFMPYDVRIANTESKARVYSAVSEFIETKSDVHYFPSYEMVTGAECKDDFMLKDGRHLHRYALRYILENFVRMYCDSSVERTDLATPWLTAPTKSSENPALVEGFPLVRANQWVNAQKESAEGLYIYGTGYLTQELIYNTEIMALPQFRGLTIQDTNSIEKVYGLSVVDLAKLRDQTVTVVFLEKDDYMRLVQNDKEKKYTAILLTADE